MADIDALTHALRRCRATGEYMKREVGEIMKMRIAIDIIHRTSQRREGEHL